MDTVGAVLDMTELESEFAITEPCVKCDPSYPREALYMVRFSHVHFDQEHVLPYCQPCLARCVLWAEDLVCGNCKPTLTEVVYISHWALQPSNA